MSQRLSEPELLFGQSETASLFQRYGRAIFAYVRLHALSYEACQDITLNVFQIAWTYDLSTIQEPERLKWLRRVASHKMVNQHRRASRHPHHSLEVMTSLVADEHTPESITLQQEACVCLHQMISPSIQRSGTPSTLTPSLQASTGSQFTVSGIILEIHLGLSIHGKWNHP